MDPVSVLGIAAASAQFVEQGASLAKFLWDLYSKLKDAPKSIRVQITQIDQLLGLARLFLQNPSLQTDSVASILGTCLSCAQEFHDILEKVSVVDRDGRFKKLERSFKAVMQEKQILRLFDNLERQKSSLMLCIQQIDDNLLHTISVDTEDIKKAVSALPGMSAQVTDIHTVVKSLETLTLQRQNPTHSPSPPYDSKKYDLVPKRRVREFIGREDILARIEAGFCSGLGPRIVVVRGLGGQGKTQVALEYCRRAKKSEVRGIFWVDAMSEDSVKKSFETISESIKTPGQVLQDEARIRFVIEQLEAWPDPWILVFDNHDDPSAFTIQDYIPESEHGRVLVTSRHSDTDSLADPENAIDLQGLPNDDALALLLKQSRLQETQENVEHGTRIVERLGYHALAITQAGSYIHLRKIELGKFFEHYNQQRKEILQQTPRMSQYRRTLNESAKETALNVFTTWELSFQQLLKEDTPTLQKSQILTLFAFFDCKDIAEKLFKVYCDSITPLEDSDNFGHNLVASFTNSKDVWDHGLFSGVIVALAQMSLVQAWSRDEAGMCHLNLHPLIQDWIRLRIDIASFKDYSIVAAEILSETISDYYEEQREQYQMSLSSKQEVLSHLAIHRENLKFLEARLEPAAFYAIYSGFDLSEYWFSDFWKVSGRLRENEETTRRMATLHERKFGLEDEKTLDSLHRYGIALLEQCKFEEAEKQLRPVLWGLQRLSGPHDQDILMALNNLSAALNGQAKSKEAEEICRQGLQLCETALGRDHPDHLAISHSLAVILFQQYRYEEAQTIYQGVLERRRLILGPEHLQTLVTLGNISYTLYYQGKYEEAEKVGREALQCCERSQGPEHPTTIVSLRNLANLCRDQGKYSEALALYQRAVPGSKKVFGPDHPETSKTEHEYLKTVEKVQSLQLKPSEAMGIKPFSTS